MAKTIEWGRGGQACVAIYWPPTCLRGSFSSWLMCCTAVILITGSFVRIPLRRVFGTVAWVVTQCPREIVCQEWQSCLFHVLNLPCCLWSSHGMIGNCWRKPASSWTRTSSTCISICRQWIPDSTSGSEEVLFGSWHKPQGPVCEDYRGDLP